jgi:hypothetical protein
MCGRPSFHAAPPRPPGGRESFEGEGYEGVSACQPSVRPQQQQQSDQIRVQAHPIKKGGESHGRKLCPKRYECPI